MYQLPKIKDQSLLKLALTHRSYVNEHSAAGEEHNNERLEFLGDAILGYLVGVLLYQRYPEMSEAQLTRLRSALVDQTQLAALATQLNIGEQMRLGKGAEKDGGRCNPSLLSDTLEAIIGAYFLDAGIEAVGAFVQQLLIPIADRIVQPETETDVPNLVDCKNRLQQWALSQPDGQHPDYEIIHAEGPDHAKEFTAVVRIKGQVYGIGKGRRKQDAEKQAAENALEKVELEGKQ